jgi:phosphatidylserine/phosphatidylglycerophosphate/cardiolipin synthase-like enzyme
MTMGPKKTKDVARSVLEIIQDLPDSALEDLVSAWESGKKITKYNLEEVTGITGEKNHRLYMLIGDTQEEQDLAKTMIVMGLEAKSKFAASRDDVEIVWTGPSRISAGVGNTKPVIENMLKSAAPGERVTIIDYRITSNAESIVEELNSCLADGVKIDLIVDKSNANERQLKKCFAEKGLARPTIYTRKGKESNYYKVHAKVIIVSDREMLVSSANLTELGTEVNFELGLLVRGPSVKKMLTLVRQMIAEEYFAEETSDEQ